MYTDSIKINDKYTHIKSNIIDDGIWNFICYLKANNIDDINAIFNNSKTNFINRVPRFYLLKSENIFSHLSSIEKEYNYYCKDSWFCTKLNNLNFDYKSKLDIKIKLSENNKEITKLIMKGFSTNDPEDPYGDLSITYQEALETNLGKTKNDFITKHFIAYLNKSPIAILSVTFKDNIAYLNNATTLKEYKGNGVAKELFSYVINYLKSQKIKEVVFATETGAYTEQFYKKLGFEIVDYGYCFEEK